MHYCHRGRERQHTVSLNFATIFDHPSSGATAPRADPAKIIGRVMVSRKELKVKKKIERGREGERERERETIWKISAGFENKCMIFDLSVILLWHSCC